MSIKPMNTHYSFENPASVYDEEAMTALELAGRQGAKINEIIEDQNNLRETTIDELEDQREKVIPAVVTGEVQKQIDNGTFDQQISAYVGGLRAEMDTYQENLEGELDVLESRMDTFTALGEGSTTGDAELADIRVGVDGVTSATAGESVRRQINELPYPRAVMTSKEVDFNTLIEPGAYIFDSCTFVNLPSGWSTNIPPHFCIVEGLKRNASIPWRLQTIGTYHTPLRASRVYVNSAFKKWMMHEGMLMPTGDDTDRTDEINRMLTYFGYVKLAPGEFHVKQLKVPVGGILEGCGAKTKIVRHAESTLATTVLVNSTGTLRGVSVIGPETEHPGEEHAIGNHIGVCVTGVTENAIIEDCFIRGFNYAGIFIQNTTTAVRSVMVSNCDVKLCHCGIKLNAESEYAVISNCVFRDNYIGVYNLGGNNKFANCGVDSNVWGFVIDGNSENSGNNGHGSAVGCSFNHNTSRAISLINVDWGYVFAGCQCHFGTVNIISGTQGILFSGCNFGNQVSIRNNDEKPVFFNGCTFYKDPLSDTDYVDLNNMNKFINCYNFTNGNMIGG